MQITSKSDKCSLKFKAKQLLIKYLTKFYQFPSCVGMIMMSCNYIHLHQFGCWFLFTFVFLLCRYPIVLKGAGCSYAVPCCYLYCTVARSKITESTDAPRVFYPGTSHVSSPGGSPMGLRYFSLLLAHCSVPAADVG